MDERRFEPAPGDLVRQYRPEINRILQALGHSEAFVTDESILSDFPIREEDDGPTLIELQAEFGLHLCPDSRLVDIARRLRQLDERQIAAGTPEARHAWVEWLGDRDASALLLSLMQAIDAGSPLETLKAMVDGWRRNALKALAANDYRADVDKYLEVSVDARLYLMARPELLRHLEDLEDEDDEA
jgi:hypothetical protein